MARVTIEDRNADGRGRGKLGERVFLVSQAHPGEQVDVRVDRESTKTVQGRVETIYRRDPERILHACPHEFSCTGCDFLAVPPAHEARIKRNRVMAILRSALGMEFECVQPVVVPVGPFCYRHFAKQVFATGSAPPVVLGSYVRGTHLVVDNAYCPVLVPALQQLMVAVSQMVRELRVAIHDGSSRSGLRYAAARCSATTGHSLLVLVTSADPEVLQPLAERLSAAIPQLTGVVAIHNASSGNVILEGEPRCLVGVDSLEDDLLGYTHRVGPLSFFQINPVAAHELFRRALDAAGRGGVCVEGYAGVGALTLPLSERFGRVIAVESRPESIEILRRSADEYRRSIDARLGDAVVVLPDVLRGLDVDTIVLDPPRRGIGPVVARAVAGSRANRVVLLSCEPASLARDLPPLIEGGLSVQTVIPVDQFPRTTHVETIVALSREGRLS